MTIKKSMPDSEHFRRLAADQAQQARSTSLPNVRERFLQAERQFIEMAERAGIIEAARQRRAAEAEARPPGPPRPRRFG